MKQVIEALPDSMLDLTSGRITSVRLSLCASGMELLFFDALPRAKLHGLNFSASERPSVIVDGKKKPVAGVF